MSGNSKVFDPIIQRERDFLAKRSEEVVQAIRIRLLRELGTRIPGVKLEAISVHWKMSGYLIHVGYCPEHMDYLLATRVRLKGREVDHLSCISSSSPEFFDCIIQRVCEYAAEGLLQTDIPPAPCSKDEIS